MDVKRAAPSRRPASSCAVFARLFSLMQEPTDLNLDLIQRHTAESDVPCPVCNYNLRGITASKCPECGARLEIKIGSLDLRIGIWLVALIGTALAAGPAAVATIVLPFVIAAGRMPDHRAFVVLPLIDMAFAVILFSLIRRRRRFWRQSRKKQIMLATTAIALGAAIDCVMFSLG